mmetsp:Transcript_85275/g.246523  ORF Transcript_85275/g.246523 Transcript_85275/m.246523 type:complete len:408 (+) Transcript_85275:136-1359(+)
MRVTIRVFQVLGLVAVAESFAPSLTTSRRVSNVRVTPTRILATPQEDGATATTSKPQVQQLGLLTFDLDDTLYPIEPVVQAANDAFVSAMEKYGFPGLSAFDIVETGKQVREEIAKTDPERAAALTHTEIRELAIRREMEKMILQRKLKEVADDWATPVDSLTAIVKKHAETWAKNAVSESIVQSVLTEWEMARHHAAERNVFPHVIDSLKKIKEEHPGVIIGAVTDGRANPLLMTFTLAPYFDFCMSWEDHQGGRRQFFKELGEVGEEAELTWIYDAARHQYAILKQAQDAINSVKNNEPVKPLVWPDNYDDLVWIHVGDDLAFDVGGSSACGAKTILVELPKALGQTAPFRFDLSIEQPSWSTTTRKELEARIKMNEAAREDVNVQINTMERLPIAINEILRGDA